MRWKSLSNIEKKLEQALLTRNIDLVKIALLSGVDPSLRDNKALEEAIKSKSVDIVKILLEYSGPDLDTNNYLYEASNTGNVDIIQLFLEDKRTLLTEEAQRDLLEGAVAFGNLDTLEFVIKAADIDIRVVYPDIIFRALERTSPEVLTYLLNIRDLDVDDLMDAIEACEISEDLFLTLLHHPRSRAIIQANNLSATSFLISRGYSNLANDFLDEYLTDASDNDYELLLATIDTRNTTILEKLLNRPEVQPDANTSKELIDRSGDYNTMMALVNSGKIEFDADDSMNVLELSMKSRSRDFETVLDNEKISVDAIGTFGLMNKAVATKNREALRTLLTHPKTKEYFGDLQGSVDDTINNFFDEADAKPYFPDNQTSFQMDSLYEDSSYEDSSYDE